MFDVVATKEDAATICLLGRRVPRTFKPVDMEEILAMSYSKLRMPVLLGSDGYDQSVVPEERFCCELGRCALAGG